MPLDLFVPTGKIKVPYFHESLPCWPTPLAHRDPLDLREHFNIEDLPAVCDELRDFIVDVVSEKEGHFGASLGVVELTVALHYAFNTPEDQLVWDVGHQAYGHKILTDAAIGFTPTANTVA